MNKLISWVGALILAVTSLTFTSCLEKPEFESGISTIQPVDRDMDAIRESKVIRLITRYNSVTYFLHHGLERGFEYEFFNEFARTHGLRVEVIIPNEDQNPIELLNRGIGDVIAANYVITDKRSEFIAFTQPYNLVDELIVVPADFPRTIETLQDLNGLTIHVRKNSSYYQTLETLRNEGINLKIVEAPEVSDTESLLLSVASGEIEATVADDNIFHAASLYLPGLARGPSLTGRNEVAWGIRKNAEDLKTAMNTYLSEHFRIREQDGEMRRSAFLNILRQRYFEDERMIQRFRTPAPASQFAGLLSPYDGLVIPIAEEEGVDWKLVIAIMAQESRFDPKAVSWAGAVGLMQILPRFSRITDENMLFDEETNIREGIRILKQHLNHYAYLDSTNQLALALASYNAGMGHVADARRLAIDQNRNPNEWVHIEDALLKLMNRHYYQHARHGFCRGIETVNYVRDVKNRYNAYHTVYNLAQNSSNPQRNKWVIGYTGMIN